MTRPANPELRDRILEAGEEIITNEGHESLNMRKLASRVGVTATSVYHYFGSKERLLLELKLRAARRLNGGICRIRDDPDPARVIDQLGRAYVQFAEEYPRLYRFLFEAPLANLPLTPEDTAVLYYTYFVARNALQQIQQTTDVGMEAAAGAMMGWTMLHGFCSLLISGTLQPVEGLTTERLKEVFMRLYAHGPRHMGALNSGKEFR